MPPKLTPRKTIKHCIKFGEILIDENKQIFLFCMHCYLDFHDLHSYTQHLRRCVDVESVLKAKPPLQVKGNKLLTKVIKDSKEFFIYELGAIKAPQPSKETQNNGQNLDYMDLLKIEEELLDPRWYDVDEVKAPTAKATTAPVRKKDASTYNDLIDAVTPFVQFKSNTSNTSQGNIQTNSMPERLQVKRQSLPTASQLIDKKKPTPKLHNSLQQKVLTDPRQRVVTNKTIKTQSTLPIKQKTTEATSVCLQLSPRTADALATATTTEDEKPMLKRKLILTQRTTKPTLQTETELATKRRRTLGEQLKTSLQQTPPPPIRPRISEHVNSKTRINQVSQNMPIVIRTEGAQRQTMPTRPTPSRFATSVQSNTQPQTKVQIQEVIAIHPPISTKVKNEQVIQIQSNQKLQLVKQPTINSPSLKAATNVNPQHKSVVAANNPKTAEILNKLQTLGLKVQKTKPPTPPATPQVTQNKSEQSEQALEIIKKLQSKGMNIKLVQKKIQAEAIEAVPKSKTTLPSTSTPVMLKVPSHSKLSPSAIRRSSHVANSVLATKPNFRKNVSIKKFN